MSQLGSLGEEYATVTMRSNKNARDRPILTARRYNHQRRKSEDINPAQNPQRRWYNLPKNVSEMAAKHGLTWGGGDWSPRWRDPMHFEWTGAKGKPETKSASGSPL